METECENPNYLDCPFSIPDVISLSPSLELVHLSPFDSNGREQIYKYI